MLTRPFVTVTAPQKVFGWVPNLDEVRNTCPAEFMSCNNDWIIAANNVFHTGWTESRQEKAMELIITKDSETARMQVNYFDTVLGCYDLHHTEKLAICGWLLSLMFRECPDW